MFGPKEPSIFSVVLGISIPLLLFGIGFAILYLAFSPVLTIINNDNTAYNAIVKDFGFRNDVLSSNPELLYRGEPYDTSMPYTYIYKYHNATGDQLVRLYLNQNGSVESIGYNEPYYMYLMNKSN
jgi:hypothetical protein